MTKSIRNLMKRNKTRIFALFFILYLMWLVLCVYFCIYIALCQEVCCSELLIVVIDSHGLIVVCFHYWIFFVSVLFARRCMPNSAQHKRINCILIYCGIITYTHNRAAAEHIDVAITMANTYKCIADVVVVETRRSTTNGKCSRKQIAKSFINLCV